MKIPRVEIKTRREKVKFVIFLVASQLESLVQDGTSWEETFLVEHASHYRNTNSLEGN